MSEKENSEFKPVLVCLKIDFVLHPARDSLEQYQIGVKMECEDYKAPVLMAEYFLQFLISSGCHAEYFLVEKSLTLWFPSPTQVARDRLLCVMGYK